jgi:hypothetical protein
VKATRRQALAGALALPAAAGVPTLARAAGGITIFDPSLDVVAPAGARPITGDPIRFAQDLFSGRPAVVLGLTRGADALLIADVGREAGYREISAPRSLGPHGWALARQG